MTYMLDTNICIYAIKNKPEQVLHTLQQESSKGLCISSITLAELMAGIEKSQFADKNKAALSKLLFVIDVVPFDDNAAIEYGLIRAWLESQGTPIGPLDTLIAAHAKSLGLVLVTNNTKEFERVPGLTLANWV